MESIASRSIMSLLLAAALVGCGGGGDSRPTVTFPSSTRAGTPSAGADMTVANFPALSGDAVEALLSTIGGDQALSQPLGAGRARAASLVKWAATRSTSRIAAGQRAQPMTVYTDPPKSCTGGGSVTVS